MQEVKSKNGKSPLYISKIEASTVEISKKDGF